MYKLSNISLETLSQASLVVVIAVNAIYATCTGPIKHCTRGTPYLDYLQYTALDAAMIRSGCMKQLYEAPPVLCDVSDDAKIRPMVPAQRSRLLSPPCL